MAVRREIKVAYDASIAAGVPKWEKGGPTIPDGAAASIIIGKGRDDAPSPMGGEEHAPTERTGAFAGSLTAPAFARSVVVYCIVMVDSDGGRLRFRRAIRAFY